MKKQIAVIGLGHFGVSVATTLQSLGHDVLALDRNVKIVQNVAAQITNAIQADATNEAILKEMKIGDFDIAIVAIGSNLESSVLTTILLKKLGVRHIIARADEEVHGSILEKIGADLVIHPEREIGSRLAHGINLSDVSDYMPVVPGYGIAKLTALPYLAGQKLSALGFGPKGKWEVALLLIQRGKEIIVTPGQGETIEDGDVLIAAGKDDRIEKLLAEAKKNKKEE
jgi:trk system potassium uptake protein